MQYWWVNQNQTYQHEVGGGYMWSPKTNSDGGRNQFYVNMTLVEPGDVVFSFCDTYIKAVGIAIQKAVSSTKPTEFGDAGANWNDDGWFVKVNFEELKSPIKPIQHMDLLRPTLPEKYSPLQPSGRGNQIYLANVPNAMATVINGLLGEQVHKIIDANTIYDHEDEDEIEESVIADNKEIAETEKKQLVMARRGQGLFRSRVEMIERSCRLTGVTLKTHLRASHIKPWCKSDNLEKLDGNNGLMLSPHVDHLFDRGFITFSNDGELIISSKLDDQVFQLWKLSEMTHIKKFNAKQSEYLEYHRNYCFKK